jgi:3-methyladenine DNA glycosylase/8-oxoguanine DNA glycosylase
VPVPARTDGAASLRREWRPGRPVDVAATLGPMRRGSGDPTYHHDAAGPVWRATRTPLGPATLRLHGRPAAGCVEVEAWGPGADWAVDTAPVLLGADDDVTGFAPRHPLLREVWRRHAGWRVPRSGRVLEALVPAILEQKVTGTEAWRAWRHLVRRYGEPAPGPVGTVPAGLRVPPPAEVWRRVPTWEWHRAGVDRARFRAALGAAAVAGRLEEVAALPREAAAARLQAVPGVGPWTAAEVAQRALGDADAVSVGDLHVPGMVGWALVGERVDDAGMLALLEPYRGHRYRVVRMIELSGVRPPRRAPRFSPRDYRAM